jgi:phosphoribosylformimino-5-aminoimidazole carboxamide ribotide isomerase
MKVIPAIDIMGGYVVRLVQGDAKKAAAYSDSPVVMAQKWDSYGVDLIHVVDLDGALKGESVNFEIIKRMARSVKAKIELGGGIRDIETIKRVLGAGIEKVVIGTKALEKDFLEKIDPAIKDKIVVGVDARDGFVHTKGWLFKTDIRAIDLAKSIETAGIKTIIYTDISKDGTLAGPNLTSLKDLLQATKLSVIASGGVSKIDDIINLKALEKDGLTGVIIGKALYEKTIDLTEAIKICSASN